MFVMYATNVTYNEQQQVRARHLQQIAFKLHVFDFCIIDSELCICVGLPGLVKLPYRYWSMCVI